MSRVRSFLLPFDLSGVYSVNYSQNRLTDPTGSSPADSTFTYTGNYSNTMTDELTASYFHNKRLGLFQPIQPMSQQKFSRVDMPIMPYEIFSKSGSIEGSTRFNGNLGVIAARNRFVQGSIASHIGKYASNSSVVALKSLSQLTVEAIAKARTKSFDAGTFAAEFNKTLKMIASFRENTFGRAQSIVRDLARTRRNMVKKKSLIHAVKTFDQAWLEGRYGWRLMAYDLNDINDALIKLQSIAPKVFERAYASDKGHTVSTWSNDNCRILQAFNNTIYGDWTYVVGSCTDYKEVNRRAGSIVELVAGGIAFVDPLVTAWEVIPFSFIADWFLNIGKNIAAFSPFASGTLKGVWTSEETLIEYTFQGHIASVNPTDSSRTQRVVGASTGTFKTYYKSYVRSKVTNPSFSLNYDLDLDASKIVDLAAIFSAKYLRLLAQIRQLNRV